MGGAFIQKHAPKSRKTAKAGVPLPVDSEDLRFRIRLPGIARKISRLPYRSVSVLPDFAADDRTHHVELIPEKTKDTRSRRHRRADRSGHIEKRKRKGH